MTLSSGRLSLRDQHWTNAASPGSLVLRGAQGATCITEKSDGPGFDTSASSSHELFLANFVLLHVPTI
jgi:hypothetical protein